MQASWSSILAAVGLAVAAAPKGEDRKAGLFAPLELGQHVSLKERAGGYEIGVVPGVDLAQKVVVVAADYIVLEDAAGVTETRIPIYAVRAVTVTQLPKEK